MSDPTLQSVLSTLVSVLLAAGVVALLVRRLERSHPGLALGLPLAVGVALRLATIVAVDGTGLSETLRGGDETTFLQNSHGLAGLPISAPEWTTTITHDLHVALFALQIKFLAFTPGAMRVTQVLIAMVGLLFLIAAIHEMAGPRASRLGAWVLMLEPAGAFFESSLHKEALIQFATGIAVYGSVRLWRHLEFRGIAIAAVGCTVAICTRPYAGWFLVSGCVLVALHGGLRRLDRPLRAMPLVSAVIIAGFLATPTLLQVSSRARLERLQVSQDYTTTYDPTLRSDIREGTASNGNNLALERVDFSTRERIVVNLPRRIRDVLLRPYPWQVQNTSQTLGAVGGLVALGILVLLLRYAWMARGRALSLTAPFLYPMFFLLVASALSAGNAGTSFRYRTHVVTLALAILVVLRARAVPETSGRRRARADDAVAAARSGMPAPVT